jgi:hypothetical protein
MCCHGCKYSNFASIYTSPVPAVKLASAATSRPAVASSHYDLCAFNSLIVPCASPPPSAFGKVNSLASDTADCLNFLTPQGQQLN